MNIKSYIKKALNEHLNKNDIYKALAVKYKTTFPKIPTDGIFKNKVSTQILNSDIHKKAYEYMDGERFTTLPKMNVPIDRIVPTQRAVTIDNLQSTSDVGKDTGAYLVLNDGYFYVLDGHHRISNQILNGASEIQAYVYSQNNPS